MYFDSWPHHPRLFPLSIRRCAGNLKFEASSVHSNSITYYWTQWVNYVTELDLHALLQITKNKVLILKVFSHRVRIRELSCNGNIIQARSTEAYLGPVAKIILILRSLDPCLDFYWHANFSLKNMISTWNKSNRTHNRCYSPSWVGWISIQ